MQTGTKISGAAHLVLVGAAVFGGTFQSEPLPFEVREVSVISAEEFAAMTAQMAQPDDAVEPSTLIQPEPEISPPEQAPPEPEIPPEPEVLPDQPPPETEVTEPTPVPVPEPQEPEVADLPPDPTPQEKTRPVDRVAPEPVAPPPPDTTPDEVVTPQVSPDQGGEAPQEPAQATAPEEANDRIVTEADETSTLAPTRSLRPPTRPKKRAATPKPTPVPEPDATRSAVNNALAEALAEGGAKATPAPTGPPLTGGEKDALRVAVSNCWNVGSLSSAALQTTVVVGVSMTPEGKPVTSAIRLLSSSGGPDAAAKQAYEAARRAIIRCGSKGYNLPSDKYSQWQEIEMTFNPERMRIK